MTTPQMIKGTAFERWVYDGIRYNCEPEHIVKMTPHNEHYDIVYESENKVVIVECKNFNLITGSGKLGTICFRRGQVSALLNRSTPLNQAKEVYYAIGLTNGEYDLIAFVLPLWKIVKEGKLLDGGARFNVTATRLIKEQRFRQWIASMMDIEEQYVRLPDYAEYPRLKESTEGLGYRIKELFKFEHLG